ncbi:hypothetical protein EYF80_052747 [Liparis tanakae]|uniref:Uncharacterized protein n=1 Tax=Liparis tanakae TaxID=230148 RepID=A0A4Z2F7V3_9TELE|nr:hypothetical protein EYF80_052747 [Liparis tanakae]
MLHNTVMVLLFYGVFVDMVWSHTEGLFKRNLEEQEAVDEMSSAVDSGPGPPEADPAEWIELTSRSSADPHDG